MEYASCEGAVMAMQDIAEYDYLFHRLINDRFVHNDNVRCDAANPGSPGFLVAVKDCSTRARMLGRIRFAEELPRDALDGSALRPEHWQMSQDKRAFILIPAWIATVSNDQNWLTQEDDFDIQEAKLEHEDILALNHVVRRGRVFFYTRYGWNLPAVAEGSAYWYNVALPAAINPNNLACFVLTSISCEGGWKNVSRNISRSETC